MTCPWSTRCAKTCGVGGNRWGKLGRWDFLACYEPQQLLQMLGALLPKTTAVAA